jgi:hypothetical protein
MHLTVVCKKLQTYARDFALVCKIKDPEKDARTLRQTSAHRPDRQGVFELSAAVRYSVLRHCL